jgi:hypothetical protein
MDMVGPPDDNPIEIVTPPGNGIPVHDLAHRFQFHPADSQNKKDDHEAIRAGCLALAELLVQITGPPSREQSLAITKLEEAMFWANAGLARGDGPKE